MGYLCGHTRWFETGYLMSDISKESRVKVTITDNIALVSLNRPEKHNAIDMLMFYDIRETINTLKRNRSIRAVIVEGEGDDFCSGLDIKAVMKSTTAPLKLLFKWLPWQANLAQFVSVGWRQIPAPVIMVIQGRCWGGGLQIALGADFRMAASDASIAIMEARWGLIPDMGGTLALKELLNLDIAKELAMTGAIIDGNQAHKVGLVTHVDDEPMKAALKLAHAICQQSPDAVSATKKLYNKSWWSEPGFALARESYYQIKILLGKNRKIKSYNQLNPDKKSRDFVERQKW